MTAFLNGLRKRYGYTPNDRETWFLGLADYAAKRSRDTTQIGAVISGPDFVIRSMGWNGFPRGVDDSIELRSVRPLKYTWTEHAERNAIFNAARTGVGTTGCFMFSGKFCCADCARGVIQSGISRLYAPFPEWDPEGPVTNDYPADDWRRQAPEVMKMLKEAKVDVRLIERAE
jgi:dCMP deaminase